MKTRSDNEGEAMTPVGLPVTKLEAVRYFADEGVAHDFVVGMRWADGVVRCAHCGSEEVGKLSVSEAVTRTGRRVVRRVWNCRAEGCGKQFTVKVGTIFESSPLPLSVWLPAVWVVVNAKNGVSSCELARDLGVTQKSAWHMAHRIRAAMHEGFFGMSGEVEADETFVGGKARNMHGHRKAKGNVGTGGLGMVAVMGLLERAKGSGGKGQPGTTSRVRAQVLRTRKAHELQAVVKDTVAQGSAVYTDALRSYNGLEAEYCHKVVDHAEQYVDGVVSTNGLENFWSLLKRSIKGTYVCPAPFHLFRYLDERKRGPGCLIGGGGIIE